MPHTLPTRYAVVSCHVERPLDDRVWARFRRLQRRRPGGFRIAALLRPPDRAAGEDDERWLERAREAAGRGPLGHHTHFGGRDRGRPLPRGRPAADQVRAEAEWLRANGLRARFFCGGNWYMDAGVRSVLAEYGYVDCTATAFALAHAADARVLLEPAWLGGLLVLPATHTLGMAARAALAPRLPPALHVYFHDTDLLEPARRAALRVALEVLGRRRTALDLDDVRRAYGR
jgi:hypothetical protein